MIAGALLALTLAAAAQAAPPPPSPPKGPDAAPWQAAFPARPATYAVRRQALYVPMKDGVRLAVDVYLPQGAAPSAKLPALLVQTRYWRKAALAADPKGSCAAPPSLARYFTARGYALVFVDVRGTGASFSTRDSELGPQEVADGATLLDWIAAQPWSSGRVGAFGQSYLGTASELLTLNHHPALKAIAPVSAVYDPYADLYRPGGILNTTFQAGWAAGNRALDAGDPKNRPGALGPCPVDGDDDGALLRQAIAQHAGNFDTGPQAARAAFRDDPLFGRGLPLPYRHVADFAPVPVLSIEATQDSGYARSGVDRLIGDRSGRQRLVLAAGNHGAHQFYAPGVDAPVDSAFDQNAEILAFFDRYVDGRDNGYDRTPKVRWFTTGANAWRSARAWPKPARTLRYTFAPGRQLAAGVVKPGRETAALGDARTGEHSRWNTSVGAGPVFYAERTAADATLLAYTSAPLAAPLEVTGSPVVTLRTSDAAGEGDWFVYLEEVDAQGRAWLVADGQLRASARGGAAPYATIAPMGSGLRRDATRKPDGRPLRIGLIPFSHRFAAGARLRVTIAGSDRAHFQSPPGEGRRVSLGLGRGGSTLDLPVVSGR